MGRLGNVNSLSDIARSLLVDSPGASNKTIREKAGILALLNLLGIMDAFYGEAGAEETSAKAEKTEDQESGAKPAQGHSQIALAERPGTADASSNILSLLSRAIGSAGQAQEENRRSPDLALLAPLLSIVTMLSRSLNRTAQPEQQGKAEEPGAGDGQNQSEKSRSDGGTISLSQLLDPKLLTFLLNFIAGMDFMRNRNADPKPQDTPSAEAAPRQSQPALQAAERRSCATEIPQNKVETQASDKTANMEPHYRRPPTPRLYHKPGYGIYRGSWQHLGKVSE